MNLLIIDDMTIATAMLNVNLEFFGGLDGLFNGKHEIGAKLSTTSGADTPNSANAKWTVKSLLSWIMANLLRDNDRADMLIQVSKTYCT
jgi:hypothetical protein